MRSKANSAHRPYQDVFNASNVGIGQTTAGRKTKRDKNDLIVDREDIVQRSATTITTASRDTGLTKSDTHIYEI